MLDEALHCIVPQRHGASVERVVQLAPAWRAGAECGRRWAEELVATATAVRAALAEAPGQGLSASSLDRMLKAPNLDEVLSRLRRLGWTSEERRLQRPRSRPRDVRARFRSR